MAENFNYKQFLMENRLGAYSKAGILNEESHLTLDQDGMEISETIEEGSNIVVVGSGDRFTTKIDGKDYIAQYDNHEEGDTIELVNKGDMSDVKSGTVKRVSPDGDIVIELDPESDYFKRRASEI